jgi:hypothetical protein
MKVLRGEFVIRRIGSISRSLMQQVNECLVISLGL